MHGEFNFTGLLFCQGRKHQRSKSIFRQLTWLPLEARLNEPLPDAHGGGQAKNNLHGDQAVSRSE